jgi:hypothetical protein
MCNENDQSHLQKAEDWLQDAIDPSHSEDKEENRESEERRSEEEDRDDQR